MKVHYTKSDDALKPMIDAVRGREGTKDKVLSLAQSRRGLLEPFCDYVKDVLSEKDGTLDDDTIRRIACIVLSTYGFYF